MQIIYRLIDESLIWFMVFTLWNCLALYGLLNILWGDHETPEP